MKIYPSPHKAVVRGKKRMLDIPLAHIEKEYHPDSAKIAIAPEYAIGYRKRISPYQQFSRGDLLFFDSGQKPVDISLRYADGTYTYMPEGREFTPDTFSVSLELKRNSIYSSRTEYSWNIGVLNNRSGAALASRLLDIFGDAVYRKAAPANISVNGRSKDINDMLTGSAKGKDFLFIEGYDTQGTMNMGSCIVFDALLETHAALWVSVGEEEATRYFVDYEEEPDSSKSYASPLLESISTPYSREHVFPTDAYNHRATAVPAVPALESLGYKCINSRIFRAGVPNPIIVYEKPLKGYVIVSHEDLLKAPRRHFQFIYNIMSIIYLMNWKTTRSISSWITDEPVKRTGTVQTELGRRHREIRFADFLDNAGEEAWYEISETRITNSNVILREMAGNELFFEKVTGTDPAVLPAEISIYTQKGTVFILPEERPVYLVEPDAKVTFSIEDGKCYAVLHPFVSSSKRIIVAEPRKFQIKRLDTDYVVVVLPVDMDGVSQAFLMEAGDYSQESDGLAVASIHINYTGSQIAYDVRVQGGGLPETYTDYDMLDIGALMGRPYREGTGAVIRLPKECEKYSARISDAIEQYKVAADKFYVVYV